MPSEPRPMPQGPPLIDWTSVTTPAGVIFASWPALYSVNHMLPSGPATMSNGNAPAASANSLTAPPVVMRPMRLENDSVNHSAPSGPAAMRFGPALGPVNSVTTPVVGLIRPIWFALDSANHSAPSGPVVMPLGLAPNVGIGKHVNTPARVRRTTAFRMDSVNHMLPSGPLVMPWGTMLQPPSGSDSGANPVNAPAVVMRPMKKSGNPEGPVNHSAPSAPSVMSSGCEPDVGTVNSVTFPLASRTPILLTLRLDSVNHAWPSAPRAMWRGWLLFVGMLNALKRSMGANGVVPSFCSAVGRVDRAQPESTSASEQTASESLGFILGLLWVGESQGAGPDTDNEVSSAGWSDSRMLIVPSRESRSSCAGVNGVCVYLIASTTHCVKRHLTEDTRPAVEETASTPSHVSNARPAHASTRFRGLRGMD